MRKGGIPEEVSLADRLTCLEQDVARVYAKIVAEPC